MTPDEWARATDALEQIAGALVEGLGRLVDSLERMAAHLTATPTTSAERRHEWHDEVDAALLREAERRRGDE